MKKKELLDFFTKELKKFIKEQSKLKHSVIIESEKKGRTENYILIDLNNLNIKKKYKIGDIINIDNFIIDF